MGISKWHTEGTPKMLHYARTFSATKRHFQRPDEPTKTLCGGNVMLADQYIGDDGEIVNVPLDRLFMEINTQKPDCGRCAKSKAKYEAMATDMETADEPAKD
jgi:hypothetical protein